MLAGQVLQKGCETYAANVFPKSFNAEAAQDEPKLQRAEATSETQMPVTIVNDHSYRKAISIRAQDQYFDIPASLWWVLRKGGVMSRASVSNFRSRTHKVEQSKVTRPHYIDFKSKMSVGKWFERNLMYLVEIGAERCGEGVDLFQEQHFTEFGARQSNSCPSSVDMHP
jgi:hypothetical protein